MKYPLTISVVTALLAIGCAHENVRYPTVPRAEHTKTWAERIADWPEASRKAAREMGHKYGAPAEVTDTQLVWHEHGPWKRAILLREGTPHEWPSPHVDVLEQVIDFRVDPERADDIARFDGSVIIERTKGEMSARCGGEAANFLAINLARDVAVGTRTAENARALYEQAMADASAGHKPAEMERLVFVEPTEETADPDVAADRKSVAKRKLAPATDRSSKQSTVRD